MLTTSPRAVKSVTAPSTPRTVPTYATPVWTPMSDRQPRAGRRAVPHGAPQLLRRSHRLLGVSLPGIAGDVEADHLVTDELVDEGVQARLVEPRTSAKRSESSISAPPA